MTLPSAFCDIKPLDKKEARTLGNLDIENIFEQEIAGWTHLLYQVAHTGQKIHADLANVRPISYHRSLRAAMAERERLIHRVQIPGTIYILDRVKTPMLVITRTEERLKPKYQKNKREALNRYLLQENIQRIKDFQQDFEEREKAKADGLEKAMNDLRAKAVSEGQDPAKVEPPEFWAWDDKAAAESKQAREQAYHKAFDSLPWIQWFRNEKFIHPAVQVKPNACENAVYETIATYRTLAEDGMHVRTDEDLPEDERKKLCLSFAEAEVWARDKMQSMERERDAARIRKDMKRDDNDKYDDDDDDGDDRLVGDGEAAPTDDEVAMAEADARGNAEFPAAGKRADQNYSICAMITDPTAEMEPGVYFFGACDTLERGKELVKLLCSELEPLAITIVESYKWMCPYMIEWYKGSSETQNIDVESTSSDKRLRDLNKSRKEEYLANNKRRAVLNDRDAKIEQVGDRVLRILGIKESAWSSAMSKHGQQYVYQMLLSLPSIAPDVQRMKKVNGSSTMLSDIFTPDRVLTEEDKAITCKLFDQKTYSLAEAQALMDELTSI